MTEIVRLDHRMPAVAEQIVDVQRAGYQVEARLTGYDGMPGVHQDTAGPVPVSHFARSRPNGDGTTG